jgi:hypothetical protein
MLSNSTIGNLAVQHPVFAEFLRVAATGLIIDIFVFRPFLRLVGFGPLGPIRGEKSSPTLLISPITSLTSLTGSLAAYAQGYIFGAFVPAGSWFSLLQRAGMVSGMFFGGLFGGLGILFVWFKSIVGF